MDDLYGLILPLSTEQEGDITYDQHGTFQSACHISLLAHIASPLYIQLKDQFGYCTYIL